MLNITKIQDSLVGLVGFRQPINPDYAILNTSNQLSSSGYFVNDNHFAKIEFIKDSQDYIDITDEQFNDFLVNLKRSSISNICNQIFSNADFIDRNLLYKNTFNKIEVDTLPNGFVGFKIEVDDTKNIAINISRVLLDFEGNGDIELILWNNAKKEALYTKVITINSDHQAVVLDWVIDNSNSTYKGEYYIGYLSEGTTVKPYKRDFENASLMTYFTHLRIEKCFLPNHNSNELFDISKLISLNETNGLNLDITVYEDYTDLVLQNKSMFARAIYLDLIINCMQIYLSSLRSNRNKEISEQLYAKVMIEIEGTRPDDNVISVKGLRPQLISEISTIKSEIEKIKEGYFGIGINVITRD